MDASPAGPAPADAESGYIEPRIISAPKLASPYGEFREAIVYLRLTVSAEGLPIEMEVMEDRGFFSEPYRREVLRYARGLRFSPATENGVPVVAGPLTQRIVFAVGLEREQQGVTPAFRRELGKVEQLMKKRDYAGAHFHAEWMLREKVKFSYEYAVLQAELARTLAADGRVDEALRAVWGATSRSGTESAGFKLGQPVPPNDPANYLLPRDLVVYLLELRMRLLAQSGEVLSALKTYNELAGLEPMKEGDSRKTLAEKLVELLQSGSALVFKGQVTGEFWSHELYHPRFTVRQVQGSLDRGHLHCFGQFKEFDFIPGEIWILPAGWEGCTVEFYGEPGTRLELVELPATDP